ncbi:MAG: excinuclease ABC subunit UvrC [Proteobacteria bacterium]|nr:excinuclease ABC subunit UvrC [Pseudomonadota bacterium]
MASLRTDLDQLPTGPGTYLMKAEDGEVLYVGKAVDLRARVKQYWQRAGAGDGRFHIGFLVPQIQDVEVVVTPSEREALILEDTLIKKYQPRYNVKLKDDKTWLSLRLKRGKKWPRITMVRRWKDDGAQYFGPYLNQVSAWEVQKLLKRTVPLRTCSDGVFRAHSERPCIEHQMGRCVAPCVGKVTPEEYDALLDEAALLLEGRNKALVRRLEARMQAAAEKLYYEEAARVRDNMRLIERLTEKQGLHAAPGQKDRDVFALHREGDLAAVALMPVREGRMQDARGFSFRSVAEEDDELLGRLITQLYSPTIPPPPEILVPIPVADAALRAELLSELAGRKVVIRQPKRGDAVRLLTIAAKNAEVRFASDHSKAERHQRAMFGLQKVLRLAELPRSIECYDNSNIGGTDPVGAMVSVVDGKPNKAGYRIFKIQTVVGADDYATMKEVLSRRIKRGLTDSARWKLPDLIVIDGGRGQLRMVVEAAREVGADVVDLDGGPIQPPVGGPLLRIISIAKPNDGEETDKLYEPGRSNAISLRAHDPALHLLQAARDEAHRFGVHHHRKLRSKRTVTSALDTIPGIGKTLRTRLLRRFGSVKRIRAATVDDVAAVPGMGRAKAERVLDALAD